MCRICGDAVTDVSFRPRNTCWCYWNQLVTYVSVKHHQLVTYVSLMHHQLSHSAGRVQLLHVAPMNFPPFTTLFRIFSFCLQQVSPHRGAEGIDGGFPHHSLCIRDPSVTAFVTHPLQLETHPLQWHMPADGGLPHHSLCVHAALIHITRHACIPGSRTTIVIKSLTSPRASNSSCTVS